MMDSYEVKVWPLPHVEVGGGGTMLLFHVRDGRHEGIYDMSASVLLAHVRFLLSVPCAAAPCQHGIAPFSTWFTYTLP